MNSGVILIKYAFWTVFAVILCCCACACTTANPPVVNQSESNAVSVNDRTPREEPERVAFESAWQSLSDIPIAGSMDHTSLVVHQIHGTGVDSEGKARSWIVGVQKGETHLLVIYDQEIWHQVTWGESFTSPGLSFQQVLLPTELYQNNQETIEDTMNRNGVEESELDLTDGMYTISVHTPTGLSLLRFNATTGESISNIP